MAFRLTRRHMLASAAASGAAFSAGLYGVASAQGAKRIEQLAPELDKIIGTDESINQLADGVGGDNGPAEGPVWWKEGGYLLFSDINGNRRMKYTPGQGTVEFKKPTNGANGLTRDLQGRLVACEGAGRRVIREEIDGTITVIASSFQGRRLNRPNDVVVKSDGAIYFSDPNTNMVPDQTDLTYAGVYRVSPDLGTLTLLVNDFITPNGLAFSPDESVLYINDSRRRHIRAFDMVPNGTLARQTDRVFAELGGAEPGVPDGMKVDNAGNVYCGGSGGLWILDPKGKKLGRIIHGQPATAGPWSRHNAAEQLRRISPTAAGGCQSRWTARSPSRRRISASKREPATRMHLAGSTPDLAVIHFFCWAELAVSSSRDTYGQSSLDAPPGNSERWHQPTHSKRAAVVQGCADGQTTTGNQ
jgi:gluconolactonase